MTSLTTIDPHLKIELCSTSMGVKESERARGSGVRLCLIYNIRTHTVLVCDEITYSVELIVRTNILHRINVYFFVVEFLFFFLSILNIIEYRTGQ